MVSKNASSWSSPSCAGDRSEKQRVVAKGYVPVVVGVGEEVERFVVSVKLFRHQCMMSLLELAAEEFGFEQRGVLRIPCDVQHFRRVLQQISD